jgi:hypothetical protein
MITPKLIALEKQLAQALPGFRIRKTLMVLPPVDQVLRGVWFDQSGYDEISFSVTAFAMPLCVSTKHLAFTFGERVRHQGDGDRWSIEMPELLIDLCTALKQQALSFLSKGETLEGFIEIARLAPPTGRTLEGLGYALARVGETGQAIDVFSQLIPMLNLDIAWQRDLADQVRAFTAKLIKQPREAQEQLAKWERETIRNLGMEEFR